ncbi:uncharacterized protein LOC109597760 [Aethina tumida]|uniref:uncharacterized protein LOC109597760 n=1 Tax=Aethina tumida TaxID=116153 RepID=UPI00096B3415|nr:uncharacterized protein LOC109597760 [Aethina tumida]
MYVINIIVYVVLILIVICADHGLSLNVTDAKNISANAEVKSVPKPTSVQFKNDTQLVKNATSVALNEVDKSIHKGREHVTEKPSNETTGIKPVTSLNTTTVSNTNVHSTNTTHSSIVPKKGVNNEDIPPIVTPTPDTVQKTTKNTTVAKPVPQKPKITESLQDDDVLLKEQIKINSTTPKIEEVHVDVYSDRESHSADYVVPIVAVILSVPLVAIIISVLYKKAADWWTHRNYRRMDFLIEGMYNN